MRKIKILVVADDPRIPSGVGTQTYKLIKGLQKLGEYDISCIAGSLIPGQPPVVGWEGFKLYPVGNGYGDPNVLRNVIQQEKPDITILFSDPRFFTWAFSMDNEIREVTKLVFYHTWDNEPFPHFNMPWYSACDKIVMLSKFSYTLMKNNGVDCECITHGGDPSEFYRLEDSEIEAMRAKMFKNLPEKPEVVFFYNNRNITRKRTTDVVIAFRRFWAKHPKSVLLMNTAAVDRDGNDLPSVLRFVEPNLAPIVINQSKLPSAELNKLYNVADATLNVAFAEGFGLSCMESLLAETPGICVQTGGLTEQMTDGKDVFGILMPPEVRTCFGVPGNSYIYQDLVDIDTLVRAMEEAYAKVKDGSWQTLGAKGREHIVKNYHINSTVKLWDGLLKSVHESPSSFKTHEVQTL